MKTVKRYLVPVVCLLAPIAIVIGFLLGRQFPSPPPAASGASRLNPAEEEGLDPQEARRRLLVRRIEVKHQLVRELLARRRTLTEIAASFRDLHADEPLYLPKLRDKYPGVVDDELHCWSVIDYSAAVLSDRPQEAAGLVSRLKEELQTLRRTGKLRLPSVGVAPSWKWGPALDSPEPDPRR